jgi:hypothetical protein
MKTKLMLGTADGQVIRAKKRIKKSLKKKEKHREKVLEMAIRK